MCKCPDSGQGMILNKRIFKSLVWLETKKEIQVYGSIFESRKIARSLIIYGLLNHVKIDFIQ